MSDLTIDVRDTETARQYFEQGHELEQAGDRVGAIEKYETAYAADPDDSNVCFRLAYNLDLVGEEDEALHLYEECCRTERAPLNALINLAILYEDRGKYAEAERCIRQVLATRPDHARANLFIKDVLASKGQIVDDDVEKREEKHNAMLDTPVTDFEMSMRTRNALRKMSIKTLGDLLKVTEAELRSYKNFGDASLEEIKATLAQKGLRLGQAIEQQQSKDKEEALEALKAKSGDSEAFDQPVSDLELSVRARKALSLLSVQTIGDLAMKTEAELMGVKNFGITSLVEIKEKLAQRGLGLREIES